MAPCYCYRTWREIPFNHGLPSEPTTCLVSIGEVSRQAMISEVPDCHTPSPAPRPTVRVRRKWRLPSRRKTKGEFELARGAFLARAVSLEALKPDPSTTTAVIL